MDASKHRRWYQRFEFEDGTTTPGKDRGFVFDKLLESDYTDCTVLDVGCAEGLLCFEAESRGARKVLGIDILPARLKVARELADERDSSVVFDRKRIGDVRMVHDYVYCLNVLHHTIDPIVSLRQLVERTRICLSLEVADVRDDALRDRPLLDYGCRKKPKKLSGHYMTRSWLEMYLDDHFGLTPVFIDSDRKDYYLAVVDKQKAKVLHVISGYAAIGKSHLLRTLFHGVPKMERMLRRRKPVIPNHNVDTGMVEAARSVFGVVDNIEEWGYESGGKAFYHFDMYRGVGDRRLARMKRAEECKVFVLVATRSAHKGRYLMRGERYKDGVRGPKVTELDPQSVCSKYEEWVQLCKRNGWELVFVDVSDGYNIVSESAAFNILGRET